MLHVFLGIIVVLAGVYALTNNWWAFLDLMKTLIPLMVVCLGITMILAGIKGKPKVEEK